jgi:predicted GNAT family N-acyltransferase
MKISRLTEIGTNNFVFDDAIKIRLKVFSDEQGIPYDNELDEFDYTAYHQVIYIDNKPIACARLNIIDNNTAKICRIAVIKNYRRHGYATELCKYFISVAKEKKIKNIVLHSQLYVVELYEKIGFVGDRDVFIEENIPHVLMTMAL